MAFSREDAAHELVRYHFQVEPALVRVYILFSKDDADLIKLLEVNAATVPTGSVEPFGFAPSTDVPFRTLIAEVTPEEEAGIRAGRVQLPTGWRLEDAETINRPEAA
jgi:hypothetical protein